MRRTSTFMLTLVLSAGLIGCAADDPAPTQPPLENGLLLALAVLDNGPSGPVPQPAQLGILTNDGSGWSYRSVERNLSFAPDGNVAWFDEVVFSETNGRFRGTGVLLKEKDQWKIAHYVLSLTIPNETVDGAIELKKERDSVLRSSLLLRQPN